MNIFLEKRGSTYKVLTQEYEEYLQEYFGKLLSASNNYPLARLNDEYNSYVVYNSWPIRRLEYSFIIREMKKYLQPASKVLDAGCGVSPIPFLWSKLGADVTAVDLSRNSIDLMCKFNNDDYFNTGKKVKFEQCDISKLLYRDNYFDFVISVSVLEHLSFPNYLFAISEMYRVLKPNGVLICTCDVSANHYMKISKVGAFSIDDIKNILNVFKDELLGESNDYTNLHISQQMIDDFWENHYTENIGYSGSRGYGAIGFSLRKEGTEGKQLETYPTILRGSLKQAEYCSFLEEQLNKKENEITLLAKEAQQRLEIINSIAR